MSKIDHPCLNTIYILNGSGPNRQPSLHLQVPGKEANIRVINRSCHELPAYATEGSSGMDLRAFLSESLVLHPMERAAVPTGLLLELPRGYEAQVRSRSGLALRYGITCLNSPGTVDSDYRGEIKVILINLSTEAVTISDGERIAQMVIQPVTRANWVPVDIIQETKRGEGGFGHTGKQ
jgi:dUTP pyrophosphatase